MRITLDDLSHPAVATLLQQHLDDMYLTSPPESVHALDLNKLRAADIRFWTIWQDDTLLGCGALKLHSTELAEIKSMRTDAQHRGRGVGAAMLQHIIQYARQQGLKSLKLETGSQAFFTPAHRLYQRFGFEFCSPFADYREDPNSTFMHLLLQA